MDRRLFLKKTMLAGAALALTPLLRYAGAVERKLPDFDQWQLSKAAWKRRLSEAQYAVLREEGTEPAFSSPLDGEKRAGTYHCAGCDLPLFASAHKFDSGTGWPSFYDLEWPAHIGSRTDYKLLLPRTEVHCARCGGHQGHRFKDGPRPTGLRYCINGVALTFRPA